MADFGRESRDLKGVATSELCLSRSLPHSTLPPPTNGIFRPHGARRHASLRPRPPRHPARHRLRCHGVCQRYAARRGGEVHAAGATAARQPLRCRRLPRRPRRSRTPLRTRPRVGQARPHRHADQHANLPRHHRLQPRSEATRDAPLYTTSRGDHDKPTRCGPAHGSRADHHRIVAGGSEDGGDGPSPRPCGATGLGGGGRRAAAESLS